MNVSRRIQKGLAGRGERRLPTGGGRDTGDTTSARTRGDASHLTETLARLVRENPHPGRGPSGRGRPPVHSKAKLDFACLYMMACNHTFREASRRLDGMRDVWDEPAPDHSWLARHMQTVDGGWMDCMLARTAELCLAELGGATAPLGADSSGAETDRYRAVERPGPELEGFVRTEVKIYIKYHVTAVPGHQIILSTLTTPGQRGRHVGASGHA